MPTTVNLTGSIADLIGTDFDARRTKVWVTTNLPDDVLIDATGNEVRLGDAYATVSAAGAFTFTGLWATNGATNPTAFQYQLHIDYPNRSEARKVWNSGWFDLTATADIADVAQTQYVPPTWMTTAVATLQGYVDDAEAARDEAVAVVGIDDTDSAVAFAVEFGTDTPPALVAALVPEFTQVDEAPLNVARYGVTGDGVTDDSTALNAALTAAAGASRAEVYLPPMASFIKCNSTITLPPEVRLFSPNLTEIQGATSADTMSFGAGSGHRLDNVFLSATNFGHVLVIDSAYNFTVSNSLLVQYAATKNVVRHTGTGAFIDATFNKCTFNAATGASVSPIHLENSANGLNATRWKDCRLNGNATMTAPFITLKSTGGSGIWAHDHAFTDITAEICVAGVLHAATVFGVTVDRVAPWDVTTYTDDIFKFSTNPGSSPCRNITVQNSGRRGGTMTGGKYDVNFATGCDSVAAMFMAPTTSGENYQAKINLPPGASSVAIGCGDPFMQFGYGSIIKLPAPATGDRGSGAFATLMGEGAMVYDSTLNKPIFSDGAVWRDAAGNAV